MNPIPGGACIAGLLPTVSAWLPRSLWVSFLGDGMQDWIKMRTDIYRDPKICLMADHLMNPEGLLNRFVNQNMQCDMVVTRNVTRCATVGATLATWGVMRHRGKRRGDDLFCAGATLWTIDDISDIPGFGAAMESVGWVIDDPEGLIFPNFFAEYNVEVDTKGKSTAAERQRRYRERQKKKSNGERDVTRDVTRDGREEERREDKRRKEENTETQAHTAKPVRCVFRKPSVQDVQEYVTSICANVDAAAFVDYYTANGWKVGRSGMKDWKAAVRNWHKRNEEQQINDHGQQAVRAGFTAQARQDAQWAVFREFDAAATRDAERAIAGSADGSPARIAGNHASLFGEESSTDDPF